MARRYFIVVGDPTTAGGEALAGYAGWRVECVDGSSREVVRVGDPVMCGQCGPTTATEGYRFALISGALLAYDNSSLACGHKLISKMQRLFSWDEPEGKSEAATAASAWAASSPATTSPSCRYDEQIQFVTNSGVELAHVGYTLLLDDGRTIDGTTDTQGRTQRVATERPQQIVKAELRSAGAPCCAQSFGPDRVPEPGISSSDSPTIDDINRACVGDSGGKYKSRPAAQAERLELVAFDVPSRHDAVPDRPDLRRSETVTVITDTSGKRNDVAVVTSETRWIDASGNFHLRSYLGIFARSLERKWRVEHAEARSGCEGCESQPTSWSLAGFGDVRAPGKLSLLFDHTAYETWGLSAYELSGTGAGRWLSPVGAHE